MRFHRYTSQLVIKFQYNEYQLYGTPYLSCFLAVVWPASLFSVYMFLSSYMKACLVAKILGKGGKWN